jgi:hypothetical protein
MWRDFTRRAVLPESRSLVEARSGPTLLKIGYDYADRPQRKTLSPESIKGSSLLSAEIGRGD